MFFVFSRKIFRYGSFEDRFCKHFVTLKKCFEVFVSFNIDQC